MTTTPAELVPTATVCSELDIDRATLARWVKNGIAQAAQKLPGETGTYLFTPAEVARLKELRGDRKQMPRGLADQSASGPP